MFIIHDGQSENRAMVSEIYYNHAIVPLDKREIALEVDGELPVSDAPIGTMAVLFINPQTNELWYEYVYRPLTQEEKVIQLEQQIVDLNIAIANIMGVM